MTKIIKLEERPGEPFPENFTGIVQYPSGRKEWYRNGTEHRLDGPAIKWPNGLKTYRILGYSLTEEQFKLFRFLWKQTLLEQTEELMKIFVKLVRVK